MTEGVFEGLLKGAEDPDGGGVELLVLVFDLPLPKDGSEEEEDDDDDDDGGGCGGKVKAAEVVVIFNVFHPYFKY